MNKGTVIALEGGEGVGKSTIITSLKEQECDFVFTREPGGSPFSEEIRNLILEGDNARSADPRAMLCLFWAARAEHFKKVIMPAVNAGKTVISDRLDASTFAYQVWAGDRDLRHFFWVMRRQIIPEDSSIRYIHLDLDPHVGLERRIAEPGADINHFDTRPIEFHENLREGYYEFFKRSSLAYHVVDAAQSAEAVLAEVSGLIEDLR